MANCITLSRLILLFIFVVLVYQPDSYWQLAGFPLLVVVFVLDGIDGYVARIRCEESVFGAIFDIAVDRVIENVLWLILVDFDLIPAWVAITFITRGFLVDAVRSHAASRGQTPFGMIKSSLGKFLIAGRFMRICYSSLKAAIFSYLFLLQPLQLMAPDFYMGWSGALNNFKQIGVYSAVALCLLRGLPVLIEFAWHKDGLFGTLRS
jgi:CDP-diacylglycerol--glycerol-3-phosphate 3-phosphatidyltransferase